MIKLICILAICGSAIAAPATSDANAEGLHVPPVVILESGHEKHEDGSYSFHFRGEDGSFREETAVVTNPGTEEEHLEVSGSYSYFDVDGKEVVVHYKAGDHGFVPEGGNISVQISEAAKRVSELGPEQKPDKKNKEKGETVV